MRKLCSYPGCSSGSAKDVRKDKAEGNRKTFFSFPKDPVRRMQWQNALQRDSPIKENEVLCELHFLEEDILRQHSVPICQEYTFTLDKKIIFLKRTAVPQIYGQQVVQDVKMKTSVPKVQGMLVMTEQPTLVLEEPPAHQVSLKDKPWNDDPLKDKPWNDDPLKDEPWNDDLLKDGTSNNDPLKDEPFTDKPPKEEPSFHLMNVVEQAPWWSLFDNIDQVELPPKWELKKVEDLAVIGVYRKTTSPIKRILINKDSTYMVKLEQQEISYNHMPMNSPEDCYAALTLLDKMLLCDGKAGHERYSEQCKGFFNPESSATLRYGHRLCNYCRMAKRRRQGTTASQVLEKKCVLLRRKNLVTKKNIQNLRRMHRRVLTKLDYLKQRIWALRKKCSEKKEEVLEGCEIVDQKETTDARGSDMKKYHFLKHDVIR